MAVPPLVRFLPDPPEHGPDVNGWIAPIVVAGGVVRGTWQLDGDEVRVAWFKESGALPRNALRAEIARLTTILEHELDLQVALT